MATHFNSIVHNAIYLRTWERYISYAPHGAAPAPEETTKKRFLEYVHSNAEFSSVLQDIRPDTFLFDFPSQQNE